MTGRAVGRGVVTGASSGIGEATARRLAREPGRPARARGAARGAPARRWPSRSAVPRPRGGGPDRRRARPRAVLRARRGRATGGSTCSSTTPARRGGRTFADGGYANVERDDGAQLRRPGAPHRGAPAAAPRLGAERDRERVERRRTRGPRRVGRLCGQQVRARRLVRVAPPRGAPRTACTWGSSCPASSDRGLPGGRAAGAAAHPLDGVAPPSGWPRRSWTPARAAGRSATCPARTRWASFSPRSWLRTSPPPQVHAGGGAARPEFTEDAADAADPPPATPSPGWTDSGRFVSFACSVWSSPPRVTPMLTSSPGCWSSIALERSPESATRRGRPPT